MLNIFLKQNQVVGGNGGLLVVVLFFLLPLLLSHIHPLKHDRNGYYGNDKGNISV